MHRDGAAAWLTIGGTMRLATCWRLARKDGAVLRFTDHCAPVVVDGETYEPGAMASASARQRLEGLDAQNAELRGALDGEQVSEADLAAGAYDGAELVERVVDWRYPWAGTVAVNAYEIEQVTRDGSAWVAQIVGLKGRLAQRRGLTLTKTCRYAFGDEDCGVTPPSVTGTVVSASDGGRVLATSLTNSDDHFNDGEIEFTSGPADGVRARIKLSELDGGRVELHSRPRVQPEPGDAFVARRGCDGRFETCEAYDNVLRFGGYPTIPGTDKLTTSPNPRPLT